jgi:hypothetical protein
MYLDIDVVSYSDEAGGEQETYPLDRLLLPSRASYGLSCFVVFVYHDQLTRFFWPSSGETEENG